MKRTVDVGWSNPEGEDFRVRCTVSAGVEEQRWGDGAHPAEAPEVEILEVIEDRPGGVERPELLALVEADFARIQERALESAADFDAGAAENAADLAHDDRRFGA
jgi:hypothetical protein